MTSPSDYQYGFDGMTHKRMLEKMKQGWKSGETPCGQGSDLIMTDRVRALLPKLMESYNLTILHDAGAGDLHWIEYVEWTTLISYRGFDLVPRHDEIHKLDITRKVIPLCDLILCRHVLNHLSPKLAIDALDNFVKSKSTYLLMTNCESQQIYWKACGLRMCEPIETWKDATKWWLELHDLRKVPLYHRLVA